MLPCCHSKHSRIVPLEVTLSNESSVMATDEVLLEHSGVISPPLSSSLSSSISPDPITTSAGLSTAPSDYELFQSIGIGCYGLAEILICRHKHSKVVGVVRQIDLEALSNDKYEEVQYEMCVSQCLSHVNVGTYYCSFVCGSKLWAIQPLMHYGSCADIMHSAKHFNNGFNESVIAIILRDVVRGLHYLHSLGYIHRSVRAKHFLIHESGIVKLSGLRTVISTIDSGSRTRAIHGHFSGTGDNICWLAPEVLAQDLAGYSYKSDIYSIGIAALELATGEAPFAGLPLTEIMMLKLRGHPPMLLRRADNEDPIENFTKTFFKVVDICVDPNPSRRPNTNKLLSLTFLKSRKKSISSPSLKDLLLPVVPLQTSQLRQMEMSPTGLSSPLSALSVDDDTNWIL